MSARAKAINAQDDRIDKLGADLAAARDALTAAENELRAAQGEIKKLTEGKPKAFWEG